MWQAPVITLNQIYVWVDMIFSLSQIKTNCDWDVCTSAIKMGMRAPKLLSSAIDIPLPNAIKSLFPVCASVDKATPSTGKLTAEKDIPSSLTLGSFLTVQDGQIKLAASATISAAKNVFAENTEVRRPRHIICACASDYRIYCVCCRYLLLPANPVVQKLREDLSVFLH
jgi:hypothetical protein